MKGSFLSHCGWNSVVESLRHVMPVIGCPLGGGQSIKSKVLVEEVGVCGGSGDGDGRV